LDCVFCIVQVFCWVPDFIVFGGLAFPPRSILELVVVESRVDDFVEFVFVFSFYLNMRSRFFDLRGESFVLIRFVEGDVECVVYGH